MPIALNDKNYFSHQADIDYMSVSQFKSFAGTQANAACEDAALKRLQGSLIPAKSTSLLVGSYVDSYFEGSLDAFKANNPEIFKTTGDKGLKADYLYAEKIIARIERDPLFMSYINGQKQVIMTANLLGVDWKIKMDAYHPSEKIVDLKIMKDAQPMWSGIYRSKVDFIKYWGYDIQGAVYQAVVEKVTGQKLPFFIAYATKEKEAGTDINIIEVTQPYLDEAFEFVKNHIDRVVQIKSGNLTPVRCNNCPSCRDSRILTVPAKIDSLIVNPELKCDEDCVPHGLFED